MAQTTKKQVADATLEHLSISLQQHARALLDQVDTLRVMAHLIDTHSAGLPTSREVLDVLFTGDQVAKVANTLHSVVVFNNARTDGGR